MSKMDSMKRLRVSMRIIKYKQYNDRRQLDEQNRHDGKDYA